MSVCDGLECAWETGWGSFKVVELLEYVVTTLGFEFW